jgi:DNA-binding protein H-NS
MLAFRNFRRWFSMAKTYSQLLQNIEALKRQAEDRRKKELAGVIGRIRKAIEFYGLTAADLGLGAGGTRGAGRATARKGGESVVYRDGAGHSWSGRGPRPRWLKEALANGRSLDDLRVAGAAASKPAGTRPRRGRKARAVKFRDTAGNTWGGMGKRPQWLRDALAAGRRLEDFLVARDSAS